jgi:GT2 family glycosyltransferase/glycosyltransferase involved in cell wall biosynthesis
MSYAVPEILHCREEARIAWAVFDQDWYLASYPEVVREVGSPTAESVLGFYLERGQKLGHSPNMFFDEAWYRRRYPAVAAAIREVEVASGFEHYCRHGLRTASPHWLYDEAYYLAHNPDLADGALDAGFANRYDHYLKHGSREGRQAHLLFDPAHYLANLPEGRRAEAAREGAFVHFLRGLAAGEPEVPVSPYFDPAWYRSRYPEVTEAIGGGRWRAALHHYLCNETPTAFNPVSEFSERFYLDRNPDIATAVEAGDRRSGYQHFIEDGVLEFRAPSPNIDLKYYHACHPLVQEDLQSGRVRDAFAHFLTIGRHRGFAALPPALEPVTEAQGKTLFRLRADSLLPLVGRQPLSFELYGPPMLTVIMVLHNNLALTVAALASLRQNYQGDIELILVDSGSTDETRYLARYVHGAKLLRFDINLGFVRACNAALYSASAECILFLNNDVELAPGAVAAALARLRADRRIGAVGGKVIRTHGLLQEAGSIVWADGSTSGYLRDASPLAPEANYVRDVDFCSAVFLLVRTELLQQLEGFDEDFAPAYYEDADLCLRIAEAGYRIVYDPAVVVYHLEFGTSATTLAAEAHMARRQTIFRSKHTAALQSRAEPSTATELFARSTGRGRGRILFVEDTVPLRMIGSGFVRSNDIIRAMARLGYQVSVFPINGSRFDLAGVYVDMPDTVEVLHDQDLGNFQAFLEARSGYYDIVWIARTHNLDKIAHLLPSCTGASGGPPRLILDTEAIAAVRDRWRHHVLGSDPANLEQGIGEEFQHAHLCDHLVAVNPTEAAMLERLGHGPVSVIGHVRELALTPRPWADRAGLLFVGAVHETDSPNLDALHWFAEAVLPLIEEALGWQTRLTVVGYTAEHVDLGRLRDHSRVTLRGAVANTVPLYDQHRVFVAPARFAAGTPYKVHEAASFGLPVVATEMLRTQLGWESGRDLLAADSGDPARFAQHVLALYADEQLWHTIRSGAAERIRSEHRPEPYASALRAVLDPTAPLPPSNVVKLREEV